MTVSEVLAELEALGSEGTRRTLMRHGARDPCCGVKVGDLQKLRRRIKVDRQLALDLWDTGVYDAMYLAGLVADDAAMTKAQLRRWAKQAYGASLSGSIVPWVATGSRHGPALAGEWIGSDDPRIAAIGWATLSSIVMVRPDEELDLDGLRALLERVVAEIHDSPNEVREAMNHFVIAVGCGVAPLSDAALAAAESIGAVSVDHGDTACRTPFAPEYIGKVKRMGRIGRKKKTAKC